MPKVKVRALNDPTFGKTDVGGTDHGGLGYIYGCGKYTVAGAIILQKITVYSRGAGNMKAGVYDDLAGDPNNLIAESASIAVVLGWNDLDIPDTATSAGDYHIAVEQNAGLMVQDANPAIKWTVKAHVFGTPFPDPFATDGKIGWNEQSAYVTYAPPVVGGVTKPYFTLTL